MGAKARGTSKRTSISGRIMLREKCWPLSGVITPTRRKPVEPSTKNFTRKKESLEGNRIYELLQLDVFTKHTRMLFTMETDAVGYMYCLLVLALFYLGQGSTMSPPSKLAALAAS